MSQFIDMLKCLPVIVIAAAAGCTGHRMTNNINAAALPADIGKYTLVVEEFQQLDPKTRAGERVVDTFIEKSGFSYVSNTAANTPTDEKPLPDNPLIVETNQNLSAYNGKIASAFKKYEGSWMAAKREAIDGLDVNQYRYVLKKKPAVHCYIDGEGNTSLVNYVYLYNFQDRKTGAMMPTIEIYATNPEKTMKAIVKRLNDLQ